MKNNKSIKLIAVDSNFRPLSGGTIKRLSHTTVKNMIRYVMGAISSDILVKRVDGQGSFYISVIATLNGTLCKFVLEIITDPIELLGDFSNGCTFCAVISESGNQVIKELLTRKDVKHL